MNKETFQAVFVSTLFIAMLVSSLIGIAWSVLKGDELFAMSFGLFSLQVIWSLVTLLKTSDGNTKGGQ